MTKQDALHKRKHVTDILWLKLNKVPLFESDKMQKVELRGSKGKRTHCASWKVQLMMAKG